MPQCPPLRAPLDGAGISFSGPGREAKVRFLPLQRSSYVAADMYSMYLLCPPMPSFRKDAKQLKVEDTALKMEPRRHRHLQLHVIRTHIGVRTGLLRPNYTHSRFR